MCQRNAGFEPTGAPEVAEPCAYIDEASAELVSAILVLAVLPPQPFFANTTSATVRLRILSPPETIITGATAGQ